MSAWSIHSCFYVAFLEYAGHGKAACSWGTIPWELSGTSVFYILELDLLGGGSDRARKADIMILLILRSWAVHIKSRRQLLRAPSVGKHNSTRVDEGRKS